VFEAWSRLAENWRGGRTPAGPEADGARADFLRGLPLIAAGRVVDPADRPLSLSDAVRVLLEGGTTSRSGDEIGPFLAQLARRLLSMGYLVAPGRPGSDPLLNPCLPGPVPIDPDCADPGLSFARAATAVELGYSNVLAEVIGRHLATIEEGPADDRHAAALRWLGPLLEDVTAQCLIVARLAKWMGPTVSRLLRMLVELDGASPGWPAGPLGGAIALASALRFPGEWRRRLAILRDRVEAWQGWQDEGLWPVRHHGASLVELKMRITECVAEGLEIGEEKIWDAGNVREVLGEEAWPPLLISFCFGQARP
jgi:hypothetical protein